MKFIAFALLVFVISSQARDTAGYFSSLKDNHLKLGLGMHRFEYREIFNLEEYKEMSGADSIDGEIKSTEYGFVPAFNAEAVLYGPRTPFFAHLIFQIGFGKDQYDGAEITGADTIPGGPVIVHADPFSDDKNNLFTQFAAHAGWCFRTARTMAAPFTGIEYHYWKRGFPSDNLFSREIYDWAYLPLGLKLRFRSAEDVCLGLNLAYRYMFFGEMEVVVSGLFTLMGGDAHIPVVKLGKKHGFKIEAPIHIKNPWFNVAWEIMPWGEYRPFGKSNIDTLTLSFMGTTESGAFYEPASDHYAFGIRVSVWLTREFFVLFFDKKKREEEEQIEDLLE